MQGGACPQRMRSVNLWNGFWSCGGGSCLFWLAIAKPGGRDVRLSIGFCTCAVAAAGVEDLGEAGGVDNIEPVKEIFATINLFLRFFFLVLGESSLLNTRSSSLPSSAKVSLGSSPAVEDTEETAELFKVSRAASPFVRVLYSFWPAIQSTPYKFVRFLMTLALRCKVPLGTPL